MTDSRSDRAFSCTLAGPAFRIREEEFRRLFARSLEKVGELDARTAHLLLDAQCEAELRELLARETECCSFFEFEVEPTRDGVRLTVRVPAGSEAALTFLLGLIQESKPIPNRSRALR